MTVPAVKICGVTTPRDARLAIELGAAYLGLNFYPPSPRAIGAEQAVAIRDAIGSDVPLVGVFVNQPPSELAELLERVELDLLQFHGDEPWSWVEPFAGRAIKALRAGDDFDAGELRRWSGIWGVLFDTPDAGVWGGTGDSWDYGRIRGLPAGERTFVAGGIRPDNVARVLAVLPDVHALDVCSGVESSPGVKDRALLERLFEEIRHGESSRES